MCIESPLHLFLKLFLRELYLSTMIRRFLIDNSYTYMLLQLNLCPGVGSTEKSGVGKKKARGVQRPPLPPQTPPLCTHLCDVYVICVHLSAMCT